MAPQDEYYVLGNVLAAVQLVEASTDFTAVLPEVRSNIAMMVPGATGPDQVAAIPGRITSVFGKPKAVGYPAFGASRNTARLLLTINSREPSVHAAMEIKYIPEVVEVAEKMGLPVISADPDDPTINRWDLDLGIQRGRAKYGRFPNIIYSKGGWAREGSIAIFGSDAVEVAQQTIKLAEEFVKSR